jgi:hypothetical protein
VPPKSDPQSLHELTMEALRLAQALDAIAADRERRRLASLLLCTMAPFLYRCPNTGQQVQAWAADDPTEDDDAYEMVTCLACAGLHLVNPKTGKVAVKS